MKTKIALAIAAVVVAGSTAGYSLANPSNDEGAESGMPVPGSEVVDTVVEGDSAGMPVPGSDVVDTVVEGDSAGSGMLVPGYEGQVDDTVVDAAP